MNIKNKRIVYILLLLVLLALNSCKTVAPFTEKGNAEKTIELAKSVKADIYASEDLNSAENLFGEGNEMMGNESQYDQAKSKYLLSIVSASNAYNKSVEPYLTDLIDETYNMIDEEANQSSVPSAFKPATALNEEAESSLKSKNYPEAKNKTLAARDLLDKIVSSQSDKSTSSKALNLSSKTRPMPAPKTELTPVRAGEVIYTVKYNPDDRDCLWKIADREMGDPLLWKEIYNLNRDIIEDPDLIYPGQDLVLPNKNN